MLLEYKTVGFSALWIRPLKKGQLHLILSSRRSPFQAYSRPASWWGVNSLDVAHFCCLYVLSREGKPSIIDEAW